MSNPPLINASMDFYDKAWKIWEEYGRQLMREALEKKLGRKKKSTRLILGRS